MEQAHYTIWLVRPFQRKCNAVGCCKCIGYLYMELLRISGSTTPTLCQATTVTCSHPHYVPKFWSGHGWPLARAMCHDHISLCMSIPTTLCHADNFWIIISITILSSFIICSQFRFIRFWFKYMSVRIPLIGDLHPWSPPSTPYYTQNWRKELHIFTLRNVSSICAGGTLEEPYPCGLVARPGTTLLECKQTFLMLRARW